MRPRLLHQFPTMPFHTRTSLIGARIPFRCLSRMALSQGRDVLANSSIFKVSDEVREAVAAKRPVVALETTIYTHGILSFIP